MEATLIEILPNLSIGVISVLSMVYIVVRFLQAMDERAQRHEASMLEREKALRTVETEIRGILSAQVAENTQVMKQIVTYFNR